MTDIYEIVSDLPPVYVWHLQAGIHPLKARFPPISASLSARGGGGRVRGLVQTWRHRLHESLKSTRAAVTCFLSAKVVQRLTTEVQHPEQKYISIHCPANKMRSSQMASCCTFTIFFSSFHPGNDLIILKKSLAL